MPGKVNLDDVVLDSAWVGRDIEWTEDNTTATFRGPIEDIHESPDGTMIEFKLGWCAQFHLPGSWHTFYDPVHFGFAKGYVKLVEQSDGTIEFDVPGFARGTVYPKEKNLSPKEVKAFGHKGPLN